MISFFKHYFTGEKYIGIFQSIILVIFFLTFFFIVFFILKKPKKYYREKIISILETEDKENN